MDRLRGYENVGHVLDVLAQMHEQLALVLGELAAEATDERRKMNLGYLAGHQSSRAAALLAHREHADAALLEQWFQIPFPEEPIDLIASLRAHESESASIDTLVSQIDAFMDRLLPHMRDRAETRNASELFEGLLEIENRERHLRSLALASFEQM